MAHLSECLPRYNERGVNIPTLFYSIQTQYVRSTNFLSLPDSRFRLEHRMSCLGVELIRVPIIHRFRVWLHIIRGSDQHEMIETVMSPISPFGD